MRVACEHRRISGFCDTKAGNTSLFAGYGESGRVGFPVKKFPKERQKIPKRTRILCIPSKPYSFHSVHSVIGSRMNGMMFRSFRKRNSSQKNTNTVYSEYSCYGIVPKERALIKGAMSSIFSVTMNSPKTYLFQWNR